MAILLEVTNFSLNNSVAVIDISVAYEENIQRVEQLIQDLLIIDYRINMKILCNHLNCLVYKI